jgi:hypothetical protein
MRMAPGVCCKLRHFKGIELPGVPCRKGERSFREREPVFSPSTRYGLADHHVLLISAGWGIFKSSAGEAKFLSCLGIQFLFEGETIANEK